MTLQEILRGLEDLTEEEKQVVKHRLLSRFYHPGKTMDEYMADERFSHGFHCIHCGSTKIRRMGHTPQGAQRYHCRDCGRTFGDRSDSVLSGTHKDSTVWEEYIDCMLEGLSLRKTAARCGIHFNTAFAWRHKLLDALRGILSSQTVGGVVEADETYVNVSYKGNHSGENSFIMPRKSRHRGGELHQSGISKELVCISCAVSRDGGNIASALTLGRASAGEFKRFFDGRLEKGSVLCTDYEPAYSSFAKKAGVRHVQLETKEVREGFMIQRINAYHSRLHAFLSGFRGVSTKYLDNYLAWNSAREIVRKKGESEEARLIAKVFLAQGEQTYADLRNRPAVPAEG